jgi:hypothetical protein
MAHLLDPNSGVQFCEPAGPQIAGDQGAFGERLGEAGE